MFSWLRSWKDINWRRWGQFGRNTLYFYCFAYVVTEHVGEFIVCQGDSMLPTMHNGDIAIAERLSVKRGNLRIGDIVCTIDPYDCRQLFCKRIAHGPLDEIRYHQNYEFPLNRVPPGHVFLIGDNLSVSNDSRGFGPVSLGLIQVRLVYRIWPPNRIGWISTHSYSDQTNSIYKS